MAPAPQVELRAVDERVLATLVHVATTQATADEVTPPLTDGPEWTAERIAWLQEFHRSRRAGLAGPVGEDSWAVLVDGAVCGQVRLKRLGRDGAAEIGLWLGRDLRGRGVGTQVVQATLRHATTVGVRVVHAETTGSNIGAQRILERAGFRLQPGAEHGVHAVLDLPAEG